jgi:hypothetical protein
MKKEISQTLKNLRIFSLISVFIGLVLLGYMIKVENEPGALPLLLILVGTIWLIINQLRIKKQNS